MTLTRSMSLVLNGLYDMVFSALLQVWLHFLVLLKTESDRGINMGRNESEQTQVLLFPVMLRCISIKSRGC